MLASALCDYASCLLPCRCIQSLDDATMESVDQQAGVDIVRRALRSPCSTIAKNAGKDPSIVVEKILAAENASTGYDALKDKFVNMIQEGKKVCEVQ